MLKIPLNECFILSPLTLFVWLEVVKMYISLLLIKRLRISHDFEVNFGHFKKIYPFSEKTSPFLKKNTFLK